MASLARPYLLKHRQFLLPRTSLCGRSQGRQKIFWGGVLGKDLMALNISDCFRARTLEAFDRLSIFYASKLIDDLTRNSIMNQVANVERNWSWVLMEQENPPYNLRKRVIIKKSKGPLPTRTLQPPESSRYSTMEVYHGRWSCPFHLPSNNPILQK